MPRQPVHEPMRRGSISRLGHDGYGSNPLSPQAMGTGMFSMIQS